MAPVARFLSTAALGTVLTGCAYMMNQGRPVRMAADSEPPGAKVWVDGELRDTTPVILEFSRTRSHTVHLKREGYWSASLELKRGFALPYWVGDAFLGPLTGGIVAGAAAASPAVATAVASIFTLLPFGIDWLSGAGFAFKKHEVFAVLDPLCCAIAPASLPSVRGQPTETGAERAPVVGQVRVTVPAANVRAGPGTDHAILVVVKEGTVLPVLDREGNWFEVRLSGELGVKSDRGFVHRSVVEEVRARPPEL